jgi:hypothetical protein
MLSQPKKPQMSKSDVRWNKMAPKPKAPKIYKGLTNAWHLDEDSGTRYDSIGSKHLSDTDVTLTATGVIGKCCDFFQNTDDLLVNVGGAFNFGNSDFHFTAWCSLKTKTLEQFFIKDGNQNEIAIGYNEVLDRFSFQMAPGSVTANTFGAPTVDTWYMLSAYYNSTTDKMGISVNAGTVDEADQTTGENTPSVLNFYVGAQIPLLFANHTKVDIIHVWNRVLTQDEVAYMYNGGVGRQLSPRS